MRPDSLLRLWLYINHLLTYLLTYLLVSYAMLLYIVETTPQERFLDHIEDDDARAIVRRCLIPAERIQIREVLGKGTMIHSVLNL